MENAILVPWVGRVPTPNFFQWFFWNLWCWTTNPLRLELALKATSSQTITYNSSCGQITNQKLQICLAHFRFDFPTDAYWSRAKCRITLWDQLYESCGIGNLIRDSARSATESTQNTTKNATNSMENAILVPWAGPCPRLQIFQWIFWNLWCWTTDPLRLELAA